MDYIESVWLKLQELSDAYARGRQEGPHPDQWSYYFLDSPKVPVVPASAAKDAVPIIEALVEQIYGYTFQKFTRRIDKWWKPLKSFRDRFEQSTCRSDPGLAKEFLRMMLSFENGLASLHSKDWAGVVQLMDYSVKKGEAILESKASCEYWTMVLEHLQSQDCHTQAPSSTDVKEVERFDLYRAIEKLTSHHRYVRELIRFAHSPRLRQVLLLNMSVVAVPLANLNNPTVLPRSLQEWKTVLGPMLNNNDLFTINQRYSKYRSTARIHCECSLVTFLEMSEGALKVPAFGYIGVSKLSCKPCQIWLECFNDRGGRQYYTRGTHGKWYYPWTAPTVPGWYATGVIGHKLKESLATLLKIRGRARSSSDSTDASKGTPSDDDPQQARLDKLFDENIGSKSNVSA